MKTHHFLAWCASTPWAMDPAAMHMYASILARGYARRDGVLAYEDGDMAVEPAAAGPRTAGGRQGSIALIQVFGTIVQRASQLGPCEGGTGCQDISSALAAANADETVSSILMQFDTPGGSVFGVQELGDQIRSSPKPVCGLADSMAASAGYWLLSQCAEAYVTPGGMVGSIGVYSAHEDVSKAMEEAGIKVTLISAGKYKCEGSPFEPLSEEALAYSQAGVDQYYGMFTKAVSRGRNCAIDTVRNGMGQGRMLSATDALAAGMVDGVMPFGDVVKKMQRANAKPTRNAMADAGRRISLAA